MSDYMKDAYKKVYKHATWEQEAQQYERNLSVMLFHNPYAKQAAQKALGRVSQVLTAYFGTNGTAGGKQEEQLDGAEELSSGIALLANEGGDASTATQALMLDEQSNAAESTQEDEQQDGHIAINHTLVQAFLKNDSSSAGQIGLSEDEQVNLDNVDAVVNRDGNLREKMTMLFNATLFNAGTKAEDTKNSITLKRMFNEISPEQIANNEALGQLDMRSIKSLRNKDVFSIGNLIQKVGNIGLRKKLRAASAFSSRERKAKKDQIGLGYQYYKDLGIKLSSRERAFATRKVDGVRQLDWKEGQAYNTMKDTSWVNKKKQKGFQMIAGPSGTAMRMLSAYRMLGAAPDELLAFRLALIGWMGSSKDHSLYEILYGSHLIGVKGKEKLGEAAQMYMTIDPLTTQQLREHAAEGNEFPHERVFKTMLDEVARARGELSGTNDYLPLTRRLDTDDAAQAQAINIYTTAAYQVMNRSLSHGNRFGWWLARRHTKDGQSGEGMYTDSTASELQNEALSRQIRRSIRVAAAMGQDTMREYSQTNAYRGQTFRGLGILRGSRRFHEGNTFTLSALTSTSKSENVAYGFYDKVNKFKRAVLVTYALQGKSGLDISEMSAFQNEQEVLLPKDTTFQVTKGLYQDSEGIYRAEVTEVAGPANFSNQVQKNQEIEDSFHEMQQQPQQPYVIPNAPAAISLTDAELNEEEESGPVDTMDNQPAAEITPEQHDALVQKLKAIHEDGFANPANILLADPTLHISSDILFEDTDSFVDTLAGYISQSQMDNLMSALEADNDMSLANILNSILRMHGSAIMMSLSM